MDFSEPTVMYDVGAENELRFTVGEATTVLLELISGYAEIFGSELEQKKVYSFPPYSSASLFSWKGCSVKLRGKIEKVDITTDSLIMLPVSIHACLEEMRIVADSKNIKGPRCLVVGPMQSGKSSFCKLLLNYAARLERQPVFVSLDVAHNPWSVPGVISIVPVKKPLNVIDSINQPGSSIFNFGYNHPIGNITLYYILIRKVGEILLTRLKRTSPRIRHSGVIIDTSGYVRREGYKALTLAAYSFQIDEVFVMEDENLCKMLKVEMPECVRVVFIPKSAAVVERSVSLRADNQDNRTWEYFYGTKEASLNPCTFDASFSDFEIYEAKPTSEIHHNDISNISLNDISVVSIPITPEFENRILGVSFADTNDASLFVTNVRGFVCIINVDMSKRVVTFLSPQPGPLPSKILIMNDARLRRYGAV